MEVDDLRRDVIADIVTSSDISSDISYEIADAILDPSSGLIVRSAEPLPTNMGEIKCSTCLYPIRVLTTINRGRDGLEVVPDYTDVQAHYAMHQRRED